MLRSGEVASEALQKRGVGRCAFACVVRKRCVYLRSVLSVLSVAFVSVACVCVLCCVSVLFVSVLHACLCCVCACVSLLCTCVRLCCASLCAAGRGAEILNRTDCEDCITLQVQWRNVVSDNVGMYLSSAVFVVVSDR